MENLKRIIIAILAAAAVTGIVSAYVFLFLKDGKTALDIALITYIPISLLALAIK